MNVQFFHQGKGLDNQIYENVQSHKMYMLQRDKNNVADTSGISRAPRSVIHYPITFVYVNFSCSLESEVNLITQVYGSQRSIFTCRDLGT